MLIVKKNDYCKTEVHFYSEAFYRNHFNLLTYCLLISPQKQSKSELLKTQIYFINLLIYLISSLMWW